jgi:TPP-dependent trihydroxycyclohexane-1,2-dione (THcHDO) dehydratase
MTAHAFEPVRQAETGAVRLAFPQHAQAEAFDVPDGFLDKRLWLVGRPLSEAAACSKEFSASSSSST